MGVLGNYWEREKGVLRAARPCTPFQGVYPRFSIALTGSSSFKTEH